jgi:predicted acyltransferase
VYILLVAGAVLLLTGFCLDWFSITPIIKRIATSSFTLASGGWVVLLLAMLYGWVDVHLHHAGWRFVTVVGMNSLFIYLFFEIVANRWFNGYITAIVTGLTMPAGISESAALILSSLVIFALEWRMCKFLYDKKIFFRV